MGGKVWIRPWACTVSHMANRPLPQTQHHLAAGVPSRQHGVGLLDLLDRVARRDRQLQVACGHQRRELGQHRGWLSPMAATKAPIAGAPAYRRAANPSRS